MNRYLTEQIKSRLLLDGMDLVGFGPVDRWKEAPFLLSPQAILPEAQTVIVAATSITDTWTEMGGEPEPQDQSPGGWMNQNTLLDRVAYHTVRFLNDQNQKAIAVVSSNIWRYRQFDDIPSLFAPDLSHMHAAVAAGLGEMVWTGLTSTPEFGPRVRFISIVTDAKLLPTPMYDGPELCDRCMDCVKCCPSYAMKKDQNGQPHCVNIGGKIYKYANKNIWRCAWAEHFDLDLNSKTLNEKDHIDEAVILNEIHTKGTRGHERGVCQKVCIPPHLRTDKPSFGRVEKKIAMNRINKRYSENMPTLRKMRDDLIAQAISWGADFAVSSPLDFSKESTREILKQVPGMKSAIGIAIQIPENALFPEQFDDYSKAEYEFPKYQMLHHILLKLARSVENYGYHAAVFGWPGDLNSKELRLELGQQVGLGRMEGGKFITSEFGENVWFGVLVTDAEIDATPKAESYSEINFPQPKLSAGKLKNKIASLAERNYVSLFGVAKREVFDTVVEDLKANINEEKLKDVVIDSSLTNHGKWKSKIIDNGNKIRKPEDYIKGAKSVIVLGMHYNRELIDNSGLETTKQIGTYTFWTCQTRLELYYAAFELAVQLERWGYKTHISSNMLGIGSMMDTPRGPIPDMRCGSIEAAAAGLGTIGKNGALLTEQYGPHQRFITIITDAELSADPIQTQNNLCNNCEICVSSCPMVANTGQNFPIRLGDEVIQYPRIHHNRCDWAKRYSLSPVAGPALIGNNTKVPIPHDGELTITELAQGCENKDMILKHRTCILEPCLRYCPAGNSSNENYKHAHASVGMAPNAVN